MTGTAPRTPLEDTLALARGETHHITTRCSVTSATAPWFQSGLGPGLECREAVDRGQGKAIRWGIALGFYWNCGAPTRGGRVVVRWERWGGRGHGDEGEVRAFVRVWMEKAGSGRGIVYLIK